jgi:two-component system response regulator PilR (NtrC family)
MPETLLESELFGHMRGAFTGADTTKKGLVEVAEGGTVFLDEIGEMTPSMQVKFLRVLQERKFRRVGGTEEIAANIRVIAATNRDLPKFVAEGKFREDLFYRLNVIPIQLPSLRDRKGDVPLIAEHFLARLTREMGKPLEGFSPEAMAALESYQWPGNVRELENVVERAVALEQGRRVELSTLPDSIQSGRPVTPLSNSGTPPATVPATAAAEPAVSNGSAAGIDAGFNLEQHLQNVERQHLERALRQAAGVQTHAAELLGLSFRQFRYLAKKYGLKTSEGR